MLLIYIAMIEMLYGYSELTGLIFQYLKKSGAGKSISRLMIPIPFLP